MTLLRNIHRILTGVVSPDDCVDLLVAYFAADRSHDPGPDHPLVERLGALGPSMRQLDHRNPFSAELVFSKGAAHEVDGRRVRFFMSTRGGSQRWAYLCDDPELCVAYVAPLGGWDDKPPVPVLPLVAELIVSSLRLAAPSSIILDPEPLGRGFPSADVLRDRFARVEELILEKAAVSLSRVLDRTFVGPDTILVIGAAQGFLSGADDDAIRATGLGDVDGWEITRLSSSEPSPTPDFAPLPAGALGEVDELPATMPLTDLDRVPWDRLNHAYGPATDIPDLLRKLASDEDEEHEQALGALFGNVFHQGTRYPASAFVVPFIGEMLTSCPRRRPALLGYLHHLAIGYEESSFPNTFPLDALRAHLTTFDGSHRELLLAEIQTHEAVARLWPLLVEFLTDDDASVAARAAHLLAYLPDRAGDSLVALTSTNVAPDATPSVIIAGGMLARHLGERPAPAAGAAGEAAADVRFASAVARCLLGDRQAGDDLLAGLSDAHETLRIWLDGEGTAMAIAALAVLPDWPNRTEAEAILAAVRTQHWGYQADAVARILPKVFPSGLPARAVELTDLQRFCLDEALALASPGDMTYINLENALPMTSTALRRYLAGDYDLSV